MRVFRIAAIIALVSAPAWAAAPAFAQQEHVQQAGEAPREKTRLEILGERDAEKAYNKSLSRIPDKGPVDPWGNVRSDNAPPKAPAKPVAKRTKVGDTAH
jgi:hypothetical protein